MSDSLYNELSSLVDGLQVTKSNYHAVTTYLLAASDKQGLRVKAWEGSTLGGGVVVDYREDLSLTENHRRAFKAYMLSHWSREGLQSIKSVTLSAKRASTRVHQRELIWTIID